MSGDPVAHLAAMIATYGQPQRDFSVAMVWAYFDETAIHERVPGKDNKPDKFVPNEMVVGGCIASQAAWAKFSRDWTKTLKKEGVGVFHAKEFYRWNKPFDWFTKDGKRDFDRHNAFADDLADIITHWTDEAIAFTSPISLKKGKLRVAYAHGVLHALHRCSTTKFFKGEATYVIFARHPELSRWSILRLFENLDWERQLSGCGVFEPEDVPPLQAADFVCHSINKSWGGVQAKSQERLAAGYRKRGREFKTQLGASWQPSPELLEGLSS